MYESDWKTLILRTNYRAMLLICLSFTQPPWFPFADGTNWTRILWFSHLSSSSSSENDVLQYSWSTYDECLENSAYVTSCVFTCKLLIHFKPFIATERKKNYPFPAGNNYTIYWEKVYTENFKDAWPWFIYLIYLMKKLNTFLFTKCEWFAQN